MKKSVEIIFGSMLLLAFSACDPKEVTPTPSKPTIEIISLSVAPVSATVCGALEENVIKLRREQNLEVKMRLRAAEQLSQYKIDIHNNFDCHAHGRMEANWRVFRVVNVTGTDVSVTETLQAPSAATLGNYHFMISLVDSKGNESDYVDYSVLLEE